MDPSLLPLDVALAAVLARTPPLALQSIALEHALGRVLARSVLADVDQPAFDRAMMDGLAVRAADCTGHDAVLRQVGEAPAGAPWPGTLGPGECVRIMTGAVVPRGADAVVMVERIEAAAQALGADGPPTWRILDAVGPEQHIARRGAEVRAGAVVVAAGTWLTPARLGVLAAFGAARLDVFRRPRVVVLPTGDEIVAVDAVPGPGQVRDSNRHAITAVLRGAGCEVVQAARVDDRLESVADAIEAAWRDADVVVLSGGVSAGDYDWVARALARVGATVHVHRIAIKPGKPFLFATRPRPDADEVQVAFGLPGNPISSLVCATLLAVPALWRMQGRSDAAWQTVAVPTAHALGPAGPRSEVIAARWSGAGPGAHVARVGTKGSADMAHFALGDVWILRAAGAAAVPEGAPVDVVWWPGPTGA